MEALIHTPEELRPVSDALLLRCGRNYIRAQKFRPQYTTACKVQCEDVSRDNLYCLDCAKNLVRASKDIGEIQFIDSYDTPEYHSCCICDILFFALRHREWNDDSIMRMLDTAWNLESSRDCEQIRDMFSSMAGRLMSDQVWLAFNDFLFSLRYELGLLRGAYAKA